MRGSDSNVSDNEDFLDEQKSLELTPLQARREAIGMLYADDLGRLPSAFNQLPKILEVCKTIEELDALNDALMFLMEKNAATPAVFDVLLTKLERVASNQSQRKEAFYHIPNLLFYLKECDILDEPLAVLAIKNCLHAKFATKPGLKPMLIPYNSKQYPLLTDQIKIDVKKWLEKQLTLNVATSVRVSTLSEQQQMTNAKTASKDTSHTWLRFPFWSATNSAKTKQELPDQKTGEIVPSRGCK